MTERMVKAVMKALYWIRANREGAIDIIMKSGRLSEREIAASLYDLMRDAYIPGLSPEGLYKRAELEFADPKRKAELQTGTICRRPLLQDGAKSAWPMSRARNHKKNQHGGKNSRRNQSRYLASRRADQSVRAGEKRRRRAGAEKSDQSRCRICGAGSGASSALSTKRWPMSKKSRARKKKPARLSISPTSITASAVTRCRAARRK